MPLTVSPAGLGYLPKFAECNFFLTTTKQPVQVNRRVLTPR